MEQINSEGIDVLAPEGSEAIQFPSGMDHTAAVSMEVESYIGAVHVTATLNHSVPQEVSVTVRTLAGTAPTDYYTSVNTTLAFAPDTQELTQSLTIPVSKNYNKTIEREEAACFFVQLCDVKGAKTEGAVTKAVAVNGSYTFPQAARRAMTIRNGQRGLPASTHFINRMDTTPGRKSSRILTNI